MKKLLLLTMFACLALTSAVLAQAPPPGGQSGPPPEVVLREYFGFTEEQAAEFQALLDARRQAIQAILPQLDTAEKALGDALKDPSPDPARLGNLLLVAHGFREQIRQAEETMVAGFNNLLTPEQKAKVAEILALARVLPALDAMHRLHLLPPPPPPGDGTGKRGMMPGFPPTAPPPEHSL